MHASLEDLLSLRDGDGGDAMRRHVDVCPDCRAELERLEAMRRDLRALPEAEPPADRWQAVERRLQARGSRRFRVPVVAGLAAAASLVLAMAMLVRTEAPGPAADPDPLIAHSQQLEKELKALERGGVMSGAEARLIAELEDRVAVVDLQLASGGLDPAEEERLWQRRVDLLMNLKAVRSDEVYVAETTNYVL